MDGSLFVESVDLDGVTRGEVRLGYGIVTGIQRPIFKFGIRAVALSLSGGGKSGHRRIIRPRKAGGSFDVSRS